MLVLLSLAVAVGVHGDVPSAQRDALAAFYDATGGPKWATTGKWLTGDPCTWGWFGVACDPSNTTIECVVTVVVRPRGCLWGFISAWARRWVGHWAASVAALGSRLVAGCHCAL